MISEMYGSVLHPLVDIREDSEPRSQQPDPAMPLPHDCAFAPPDYDARPVLSRPWEQFGEPEQDRSDVPIFGRGYGFPTFTGTGFDPGAVAGLAAYLSIQTLFAGEPKAYPDSPANLINWSNRGAEAGNFPVVEHHMVVRQKQCRQCQRQIQ